MIQDRLTAKFLRNKPAKATEPEAPVAVKPKSVKTPVMDDYTRGRRLSAAFWL
ncbi:hypothetical protein Q4555_10255 [Octadecabacter sp. 1_MG-2023]|uniref:hypothetical protein n=1 Tax=unclassified Octadecabacter TaxID=196158 RepID=UPI001C0929A6|nr:MULTISPECIES: hypothetical protein [unclassified Octadecabacter]MBU2992189.1 hypothetical protein [Octadecabacter sp. B2R22]MDO6735055.1 hypothetical protein [Octadecabacter sp. 1_MG-2023]